MNYWYMYTILHEPQLFLIHVLPIYRYTNSLDTVISYIGIIITWMLGTQLYHVHTSLLHMFTAPMYCFYILVIWITVHITCIIVACIFLYSRYMIISRYCYWYSRYRIHKLLICNVWNSTSIVFRFPISYFMLSTELMSCYRVTYTMYCTCSWYTV